VLRIPLQSSILYERHATFGVMAHHGIGVEERR